MLQHCIDVVADVCHWLWAGKTAAAPGELLYFYATAPGGGEETVPQRVCRHGSTDGDQGASLPPRRPGVVRCVCISDTHERHTQVDVPAGDVLLVAGDLLLINRHFSASYSEGKLEAIAAWMRAQPCTHRVFIGGNHDLALETLGPERVREIFHDCVYLEDSPVIAAGLTVWGSPYYRGNSANSAFRSGAVERLAAIPLKATSGQRGCDILLTHGPLRDQDLAAVAPRLHVCGHIHGQYGVRRCGDTVCVNASTTDARYSPSHPPIVVDLAS